MRYYCRSPSTRNPLLGLRSGAREVRVHMAIRTALPTATIQSTGTWRSDKLTTPSPRPPPTPPSLGLSVRVTGMGWVGRYGMANRGRTLHSQIITGVWGPSESTLETPFPPYPSLSPILRSGVRVGTVRPATNTHHIPPSVSRSSRDCPEQRASPSQSCTYGTLHPHLSPPSLLVRGEGRDGRTDNTRLGSSAVLGNYNCTAASGRVTCRPHRTLPTGKSTASFPHHPSPTGEHGKPSSPYLPWW